MDTNFSPNVDEVPRSVPSVSDALVTSLSSNRISRAFFLCLRYDIESSVHEAMNMSDDTMATNPMRSNQSKPIL